MGEVVPLDEPRRRRLRRRRRLKLTCLELGRLRTDLPRMKVELAAAALVTVGRNLVRAVADFGEALGPFGEDLGHAARREPTRDRRTVGQDAPLYNRAVNRATPALDGRPGGQPWPAFAAEPAAHGGQAGLRGLEGGLYRRQPREMTAPEFWAMIGVSLEEVLDELDGFLHRAAKAAGLVSGGLVTGASGCPPGEGSESEAASLDDGEDACDESPGRPKGGDPAR